MASDKIPKPYSSEAAWRASTGKPRRELYSHNTASRHADTRPSMRRLKREGVPAPSRYFPVDESLPCGTTFLRRHRGLPKAPAAPSAANYGAATLTRPPHKRPLIFSGLTDDAADAGNVIYPPVKKMYAECFASLTRPGERFVQEKQRGCGCGALDPPGMRRARGWRGSGAPAMRPGGAPRRGRRRWR